MSSERIAHELAHGKFLAAHDAERIWGWHTPAGRIRADRRAQMVINGADLRLGMNILEIGCGTGVFTERLARSGAKITAIDLSADLLHFARNRGLDANQVQFIEGRFEDAQLPGGFDAVVGSSVLHHLEVEAALRKIHALVRPGGAMAFAEPNMLNPQIAIQKNIPAVKRWSGDSPDETAFVRFSLRRLLEQIGFVDIRITPFDWLHPSTPKPVIPLVRAMGNLVERVPGVREFAGSLVIAARVSSR
ncbi:MAG TPA: class I SAM-dependent methyltransferase [Tepidisphaeraceae bacterium]